MGTSLAVRASSGARPIAILDHTLGVTAAATDSGGEVLVSGDGAGMVRACDFRTGRALADFPSLRGPITSLALHPSRLEVAVASARGGVCRWEPGQGLRDCVAARAIHVAYRRDGSALRWIGGDGSIGEESASLHRRPAALIAAANDHSGRWVAVSGHRRDVHLLDVEHGFEGRALTGHRGNVAVLAFDATGEVLASAGTDCAIRLWHTNPSEGTAPPRVLNGHQATVLALCFSPDGNLLASGDASGEVRLWNWKDLESPPARLTSSASSAEVLVFGGGAGGSRLAVGGSSSQLTIWNLEN